MKDSLAAAQILIKKEKKFSSLTSIKKIYAHDTKKEALNWVEKDGKKSRHKRIFKLRGKLKIRWEGNDTQKSTENSFSCRLSKLSSSIDLTAHTKKKMKMFEKIVINENEYSSGWSWGNDKIKV